MIAAIIALGIHSSTVQSAISGYSYPPDSEVKFNVKVQLDGYIPLFGGRVGKADVDMVVVAKGVASKKPDIQAVESEVADIKAIAFGSALPLNKTNISQFFPKGAATFGTDGAVISNDVPERPMPVKLPGLDSQKLPEISYLPLVLNLTSINKGEAYSFKRSFNKAEMTYTVTPGETKGAWRVFNVSVSQDSNGFEDAYGNPCEEASAKSQVKTVLTGKGVAFYNLAKNVFDKVVVETDARSDVKVVKTGKTTNRNLKTTLTIIRDGAKVDE